MVKSMTRKMILLAGLFLPLVPSHAETAQHETTFPVSGGHPIAEANDSRSDKGYVYFFPVAAKNLRTVKSALEASGCGYGLDFSEIDDIFSHGITEFGEPFRAADFPIMNAVFWNARKTGVDKCLHELEEMARQNKIRDLHGLDGPEGEVQLSKYSTQSWLLAQEKRLESSKDELTNKEAILARVEKQLQDGTMSRERRDSLTNQEARLRRELTYLDRIQGDREEAVQLMKDELNGSR